MTRVEMLAIAANQSARVMTVVSAVSGLVAHFNLTALRLAHRHRRHTGLHGDRLGRK